MFRQGSDKAMNPIREIAFEVAKVSPPATITSAIAAGFSIDAAIKYATLIYAVVMAVYTSLKFAFWLRDKIKGRKTNDALDEE